MGSVTSQADVFLDLQGLLDAIEKNPTAAQNLTQEREVLAETLGEIQTIKARQVELKALRQEATQQLTAALKRGRHQAIEIRSVIRGKVGLTSELLALFGISPLRPRQRKAKVVYVLKNANGGAAGTGPGASTPPSSKPVV
ncbi:MAG TPA: hypothetical protein DD490_34390 [Acidobacteria bacterium]|nr:hypothetical protein [Acidobacteriota bacterium]